MAGKGDSKETNLYFGLVYEFNGGYLKVRYL